MSTLNLVDAWFTIQGEGFNSGRRALFVRLPFCNLTCHFCDTEFNKFTVWQESDFVSLIKSENARFAVLTGGEPSMNKQTPRIIELLKKEGFQIAMESNGNFTPPAGVDHLTLSPKKYSKIPFFVHPEAERKATEFKYVIEDDFDFSILERHSPDGRLYYLSPEWNKMQEVMPKLLDYISKKPWWRLSLQTHKWIGVK